MEFRVIAFWISNICKISRYTKATAIHSGNGGLFLCALVLFHLVQKLLQCRSSFINLVPHIPLRP